MNQRTGVRSAQVRTIHRREVTKLLSVDGHIQLWDLRAPNIAVERWDIFPEGLAHFDVHPRTNVFAAYVLFRFSPRPSLSSRSGLRQQRKFGELRQYHCIQSLIYTRRSTRIVTLSYSLQPNPPVCAAFQSLLVSKPLPGQPLHFMRLNLRSLSIRMRCFTV